MRNSPMPVLLIAGITLLVAVSYGAAQQPRAPVPAVPVDAVTAIVDAFQSHRIVTLPDWHGNQRLLDFTLALLRDPRLPAAVNDIVVENTNARYQSVMDRYVRSEDVALEEVLAIWEDTTVQPTRLPEVPVLYRTVREVNSELPRDRQIRILLGEPPIDSMNHWLAQTIVSNLERATAERAFNIWYGEDTLPKLQPSVTSWRTPSLALLRGTILGAADFGAYAAAERMGIRGDDLVPLPKEEWRALAMEEQFDAVLYLAPAPQ
jgi:hypothetical protein